MVDSFYVITKKSTLNNQYIKFNFPKAINHITDIKNNHFNNYASCGSKYYGT